MKSSKFAMVGMSIGFVFMQTSIIRYYFLYPDIDKLLAYVLLGLAFIGMCFNYNAIKLLAQKLDYVDDVMAELIERRKI